MKAKDMSAADKKKILALCKDIKKNEKTKKSVKIKKLPAKRKTTKIKKLPAKKRTTKIKKLPAKINGIMPAELTRIGTWVLWPPTTISRLPRIARTRFPY